MKSTSCDPTRGRANRKFSLYVSKNQRVRKPWERVCVQAIPHKFWEGLVQKITRARGPTLRWVKWQTKVKLDIGQPACVKTTKGKLNQLSPRLVPTINLHGLSIKSVIIQSTVVEKMIRKALLIHKTMSRIVKVVMLSMSLMECKHQKWTTQN